ncbi:MAG: hypothetical protein IJC86_02765 [Clostridia bacterium]|nr:hypothetical protein [Clostridia bacterium]
MGKWETFKNKHLGKITKIISWLINIAGLVLAILSFINSEADLGWFVVLSIVILNSIFLIVVSIYETLIYKKGAAIEKKLSHEKNTEISNLELALKINEDLTEKLRYYYKYIISTLNKFTTQLCAVNSKLAKSRKSIEDLLDEYESKGEKIDEKVERFVIELKQTSEQDYKRSMMKEYNHFLSNITNKLKFILDASLKSKNCILETSISIKQFNRIVTDPTNISDVTVITTFRDSQAYSQGKREIGVTTYCINKNTDFIYCLSHPYFIKNNIKASDRSYDNENLSFLKSYNCTIVVPIKYAYPDCNHIYGYLTCDILNDDFTKDNLLDEKMAEIMEATANIIGTYFDNMDYQWEYILEDDFLDIVFNMKKSK